MNTDVYQHGAERLSPLGEQSGLPQQLCALASAQTSQWGPVGTPQLWDTERHTEAAAEHPMLLLTALPCADLRSTALHGSTSSPRAKISVVVWG